VRAAFGKEREVELVREVWGSPAYLPELDLVAEDGGVVVGHVLLSRGDLEGRPVAALAPMAVAPDRQDRGIGSALVEEAIRRADAAGFPLVALIGHWDYYPRFGFEPGLPLGIEPLEPEHLRDPRAFMVRRLTAFDETCRGRFRYAWELGRPVGHMHG